MACLAVLALFYWPASKKPPLQVEDYDFSPPQGGAAEGEGRTVKVERGWNLSFLAKRYYGAANLTLIDLILEANPYISDPHGIQANQSIKIPQGGEETLLIRASGQTYKVLLGTYPGPSQLGNFRDEPVLRGKKCEGVPRKISPRETWYRIVAWEFRNKEGALKTIQALKQKGLLPWFPGIQKKS